VYSGDKKKWAEEIGKVDKDRKKILDIFGSGDLNIHNLFSRWVTLY